MARGSRQPFVAQGRQLAIDKDTHKKYINWQSVIPACWNKESAMIDEAVAVLTYKSVETCLDVGGTQSWALDRAHAMQCRYAVLCRNGRHPDVEDTKPHRVAFMVGKIGDVVPSTDHNGRWLITFSEYAEIDVPNVWKGGRNPVSYTTLEALGISLDGVKFKPMPERDKERPQPSREASATSPPSMLTIAEAKKALAATFGVKPDAVEITIRG
jgi:hypothetical protein